jgi:hypothetical protein
VSTDYGVAAERAEHLASKGLGRGLFQRVHRVPAGTLHALVRDTGESLCRAPYGARFDELSFDGVNPQMRCTECLQLASE